MNKKIGFLGILFSIIILCIAVFLEYNIISNVLGNKMENETKAIVVRVEKDGLDVVYDDKIYMRSGIRTGYYTDFVSFSDEGNIGFKRGQEILVKYSGAVPRNTPGNRVNKIKILNQNSLNKIPMQILRKYYYSEDNVSVKINEFTKTGINYCIIDNNEFPYNYGNGLTYKILKNKNEEYYIEKKISDTSWRDTIVSSKEVNNNIFEKTYNWENLYGKLDKR